MRIIVTQQNIDNGGRMMKSCCPIALSLKDAGKLGVSVDERYIKYTDSKGQHVETLPQEATKFIKTFDNGGSVCPFEFETKPLA
jgi:hypothetical protein